MVLDPIAFAFICYTVTGLVVAGITWALVEKYNGNRLYEGDVKLIVTLSLIWPTTVTAFVVYKFVQMVYYITKGILWIGKRWSE